MTTPKAVFKAVEYARRRGAVLLLMYRLMDGSYWAAPCLVYADGEMTVPEIVAVYDPDNPPWRS